MKKINFKIHKILEQINPKTYQIGMEYFNLKKVSSLDYEQEGDVITVDSTCNGYKMHYEIIDDDYDKFFCQCYVGSKSVPCKHFVASLLKLDAEANINNEIFYGINIKKKSRLIQEHNISPLLKIFDENNFGKIKYFNIFINKTSCSIEILDIYKAFSSLQIKLFIDFLYEINVENKLDKLIVIVEFIYRIFTKLMNSSLKAVLMDDEIDELFNLLLDKTNEKLLSNLIQFVSDTKNIYQLDKIIEKNKIKFKIDCYETNLGYLINSSTILIGIINSFEYSYVFLNFERQIILVKTNLLNKDEVNSLESINTPIKDAKNFNKKINLINSFFPFDFTISNQFNREKLILEFSLIKNSIKVSVLNDKFNDVLTNNNLEKLTYFFKNNNEVFFKNNNELIKFIKIINEYKKNDLVDLRIPENLKSIFDDEHHDISFSFSLQDKEVKMELLLDDKKINTKKLYLLNDETNNKLNLINIDGKYLSSNNFNIDNFKYQMRLLNPNLNDSKIDHNKIFYIAKEFKQEDFIKFVNNFDSMEVNLSIDDNLIGILKDYQLYGVKWIKKMLSYSGGCILADEMGLGKTVQTIAYINDLQKRNSKPLLIITPFSLIENWKDEFKKFDPNKQIIEIFGNSTKRKNIINNISDNGIYLTNYHKFITDWSMYAKKEFSLIVLDEGQYIKNKKTSWSKNIKKIKSDERLILTGTPIENNIMDIWSLFEFILPDYLPNEKNFRHLFNNNDNLLHLSFLIKPFILQRKKKDKLPSLPDKEINYIHIDMNEEEIKKYDEIYDEIKSKIHDFFDTKDKKLQNEGRLNILAMITRLRQYCCDPRIIDPSYEVGSKTKYIISLINELQNDKKNKIVIFSSFVTALDILKEEFKNYGIQTLELTGVINKMQRTQVINEFNQSNKHVLLVSLRIGGVGINLSTANIIIHLNPWWNDSVENQATDRLHRIGQKNKVKVYNLILNNSIETKILKLKKHKNEIINTTINATNYIELFKLINNESR